MNKLHGTLPKDYYQSFELIRLLMTPFVCIWAFGFPEKTGYVSMLSGFVIPAYLIFSGFCVYGKDAEGRSIRLGRAILRSALFFAVLLLFYVALNVLNPYMFKMIDWSAFRSKRLWFNFLVLNMWPLPIGDSIWFIQSVFYAYVILWIAEKTKLMKFYKPVLAVLMIFMLLTGEFSGVIRFHVLGYTFLPGGAITRALPYLLLGMMIREKADWFWKKPVWLWPILFVIGGAMVVGEVELLSKLQKLTYLGHMIGFGVMAVAICGLAISLSEMDANWFSSRGNRYAKRIYAFHNPVYYILFTVMLVKTPQNAGFMVAFGSLITFFVCIVISLLITLVKGWLIAVFSEPDEEI